MLELILLIPAVAAAIALLNARMAPWTSFVAALAVLSLAIDAALKVAAGAILHGLGGALSLDAFAALYLLLVAFVGATAALYSIGYIPVRRERDTGSSAPRGRRYYTLFNVFLVSMLAIPLLANLAIIWIAIELTTVFSAFLVAWDDTAASLEAAWKYVALTTMGAMIALLGTLILYYGISSAGQAPTWSGLAAAAPGMAPALLLIAFVLWLVGFGAKAGLVPLHTWLPDAHSQAPAPICALLSGVETSGALYMLLRIAPALLANDGVVHPERWYLAAGLASVAVSAVLLLQVRDFKRLFAYSTIEHMGIVLAACGLGGGAHQLGTTYQFFAHAFTKSFCFYTAGLATIILGSQRITAGTGLIGRAPMTGWALLLGGIAIAGAPPFAIFVGEFEILRAGFLSHQYLASGLLTALVVLAFIAIMYQVTQVVFGEPTTPARQRPAPVTCIVATAAAFVPVLVFGVYVPAPLQALIHQAAQIMGGT